MKLTWLYSSAVLILLKSVAGFDLERAILTMVAATKERSVGKVKLFGLRIELDETASVVTLYRCVGPSGVQRVPIYSQ